MQQLQLTSNSVWLSGKPSKVPSPPSICMSSSRLLPRGMVALGRSLKIYFLVEAPKEKTESIWSWVGLCPSNRILPMKVPWAGGRRVWGNEIRAEETHLILNRPGNSSWGTHDKQELRELWNTKRDLYRHRSFGDFSQISSWEQNFHFTREGEEYSYHFFSSIITFWISLSSFSTSRWCPIGALLAQGGTS